MHIKHFAMPSTIRCQTNALNNKPAIQKQTSNTKTKQ